MWKDKIKEIIYMLENSDVNEIEVRFWFKKIKVTKKPAILNVDSKQLSFDNQNIPNLVKEQPINQSSEASKDIPETKLIEIKSPMPGTFYSAPDPESPSFVNIGYNVNDLYAGLEITPNVRLNMGFSILTVKRYATHLNVSNTIDSTADRVDEPGRSFWGSLIYDF